MDRGEGDDSMDCQDAEEMKHFVQPRVGLFGGTDHSKARGQSEPAAKTLLGNAFRSGDVGFAVVRAGLH